MSSKYEIDLPWDPLWEYILGENEGKKKKVRRRKKKDEQEDAGFLSYLFAEEEESRDESWHSSLQESVSVSNQCEKREDDPQLGRVNNSFASNTSEPKAKSRKFWKRNKPQPQEDDSNAWEWTLDPDITSIGPSDKVEKRERKVRFAHKRQSQKDDSNAWEWPLNPDLTSCGPSDNVEKRERKVRFAKLNFSKDTKDDDPDFGQRVRETTEMAAVELQKGQKSLLDWVGITGVDTTSTDEKETDSSGRHSKENLKEPMALTRTFHMAKEPAKVHPPETTSFPFVGLLNSWGDMTSSGEASSAASTFESTQGSGTVTSTEEASVFTDDEEDSKCTMDQSEVSTINQESEDDCNEVLLAFKPAAREETTANLLPILEEENSVEIEKHVYADNAAGSYLDGVHEEENQETLEARDRIEGYNSILEELEEFDEMRVANKYVEESVEHLEPSSPTRRVMCRSLKSLTCQQLKWSAETGLPFHELSQQELSSIFPKVRSVTDSQEGVSSELIGNSDAFAMEVPAHLQAEFQNSGPQSLFEYEYETGVHMFVSYYDFGDNVRNIMRVDTAPTPPPRIRKGAVSLNKTMIQVEASTVSQTDCMVRQGKWWGSPAAPLPTTPGVDVVGKLYRVDKDSMKRYSLSKGDRVLSLVKWGGNSRYLSVDPSRLVKVPESVDPAEAVCLAETYLAAFQILHLGQNEYTRYHASSLKGKKILLLGYSLSNIGRAIAQLAACAGSAQVYALAKPKHFHQLQSLGVVPFDKESVEWWDALNKTIDTIVSIEEEVVSLHYKCLKPGGQVVILHDHKKENQGKSSLFNSKKNLVRSLKKWKLQNKTTCFYDVYEAWDKNIEKCKDDLRYLIHALEKKQIAPKLIDRIPLSKVSKAHELIGSKHLSGFVICEPWLVAKSRAIRV